MNGARQSRRKVTELHLCVAFVCIFHYATLWRIVYSDDYVTILV